jgi:MFS family permease
LSGAEPLQPPESDRRSLLRRAAIDISPLRESRPFRRLWLGQAVSYFGSMISLVAIPYQVYSLTGAPLLVGLLGLAGLVPLMTVSIVAGAIADAVDRRRLLLIAQLGLITATVANLVNALLPSPRVWVPFAVVVLGTSSFSIERPASRAMIPHLVGEERIAQASALQSLYSSFGAVAGPALGGILISVLGVSGAYAVDLASYSASLLAVWALPRMPPVGHVDAPSLASIMDGLRYVRGNRVVLGVLTIDSVAMVFGMPSALLPALGEELGGGARTVGFLYAAPWAGALVALLVSGLVTHGRRQGLGVFVAILCWGVAIGAVGLADSLPLVLLLLAVAGASDAISAVLRSAITLAATPDAMRGRISGIEFAQVAGTPHLGNLEAGVVASLVSVRFSIASGGAMCILGAIAVVALIPELVRYRRS